MKPVPLTDEEFRRRFKPDADYAIRIAVVTHPDPALIREARQKTHDFLIAELGDRRQSGVTWVEYDTWRGLEILDEMEWQDGPNDEDTRELLRANPYGRLVVAMVEAVKS